MKLLIDLAERRVLPDMAIRHGVRRLLAQRLDAEQPFSLADATPKAQKFAQRMSASQAVIAPESANAQHYECPTRFFEAVLGPRMKYSCGYWPNEVTSLAASEEAMLQLTCERARLEDGMRVLDLGCGWGSLALWIAEHYRSCHVTAMSNSKTQRAYILSVAEQLGLENLEIQTCNIADYQPSGQYDRVMSIEMFEHVRNHGWLFEKIAAWLKDEGRLFFHVFCHRVLPYTFEDNGSSDWMTRHFFTGGVMPSERLFEQYDEHLMCVERWWMPGDHYAKTCNAWLAKLDANLAEARTGPVDRSRETGSGRPIRGSVSCADCRALRLPTRRTAGSRRAEPVVQNGH